MGGISEISKNEAHQKKLERLFESRKSMLSVLFDTSVLSYCEDEKCDCIRDIQEKFLKSQHVPQIVDIEDFKTVF